MRTFQHTLLFIAVIAITLLSASAASAAVYYSTPVGSATQPIVNGQYRYTQVGAYAWQPRMPVLVGNEHRPSHLDIVPQQTAYPIGSQFLDNNDFLGHRSNWDGRTAWYSAFDGYQRLSPSARTANPMRNYDAPRTTYASPDLNGYRRMGYVNGARYVGGYRV